MKQFKTRDSATAFMRKNCVKREHYNNFITTDVVGGKPVYIVDTAAIETYLDLKDTFGDKSVDGNYDHEDASGNVAKGDYHNEDGSYNLTKEDKPEDKPEVKNEEATKHKKVKKDSKRKTGTPPLDGSDLDKRARERLEAKKKPEVVQEGRKRKHISAKASTVLEDVPPTVGILKSYPSVPTKSIRAFVIYLILEGLDNAKIFGGMKEVFGEDKCKGKSAYPNYYRRQLRESKQLGPDGKPHKH